MADKDKPADADEAAKARRDEILRKAVKKPGAGYGPAGKTKLRPAREPRNPKPGR
jgi:hypothetical protein